MRGLGGFVLLAGIGVGLFVYFPAPVDSETNLQQATRALAAREAADEIAIAPVETAPAPLKSRLASFSPQRPLVPAGATFAAKASAAKAETVAHWPAQVMPAQAVSAAAVPSGGLEPSDPSARHRLIVDIQQHLKRAGCYWGRANGAWTAGTREAMQNFTERTNAALPVDKPDYLLLNLLKAYDGRACGAADSVTASQPKNGSGAAAAAQPEVLPWKAANTQQAVRLYTPLPHSTMTTNPLPGRMAIGGPTDFAPAVQAPLIPGPGNAKVATAEIDQGPATHAAPTHSSAPKPPRQAKKSSGSWRKPAKGTPRYNLMLSLGGVY